MKKNGYAFEKKKGWPICVLRDLLPVVVVEPTPFEKYANCQNGLFVTSRNLFGGAKFPKDLESHLPQEKNRNIKKLVDYV